MDSHFSKVVVQEQIKANQLTSVWCYKKKDILVDNKVYANRKGENEIGLTTIFGVMKILGTNYVQVFLKSKDEYFGTLILENYDDVYYKFVDEVIFLEYNQEH